MKVHSLFNSLQGEGLFQGYPSFFIRLYGCNLNCDYCDALEAVRGENYVEMTVTQIVAKVKEAGIKDVCITGGEPFCQKEELVELVKSLSDYRITLETNGSMDISDVKEKNVYFSIDWKTPGSGSSHFFEKNRRSIKSENGWIKFVVSDIVDLEFVRGKLKYLDGIDVFVSPVFEKGSDFFAEVLDFTLKNGVLRFQLQLHKILGIE